MAVSPAASSPHPYQKKDMGRSNHYVSPSTKIRSLQRALKYLNKNQVLPRKLPVLTIEKAFTLDIPPAYVKYSTSQPSLHPKQKCAKPMNCQDINKQPYHKPEQPNQRNLGNNSRNFQSGRRQLSSEQPSSKIQCATLDVQLLVNGF